jgi:transposase-like protein
MRKWLVSGIEAALEHEVEQFAGAGRHERCGESRRTYRCGYRPRSFVVLGQKLTFRVPRVRKSGFRSEFLGYRKRRADRTDRSVVEAYISGSSMRETTALLYEMWGTSVSPSTVSQLVGSLDRDRRRFQSRRLSDDYLYLVLDGMYVRCQVASSADIAGVKGGRSVQKVAVLLARGIRHDGRRELVDFRLAPAERESAWEGFLMSLYNRGLTGQTTSLFIHDGSDGLDNALSSVLGADVHQRCICHKLRNVWDAVSDKDAHASIRGDAAWVYDVETAKEACERLEEFSGKWRSLEPSAVASLESDFDKTLSFLSVPRSHRRWVTTTNPIERYIREVRRRTRPMGTFQSLWSCRRLIYVAIHKLSNERRNAIPYSLWPSQPHYGRSGRRKRRRRRRVRMDRMVKAFGKGFLVS